jgi:hypothetical protein
MKYDGIYTKEVLSEMTKKEKREAIQGLDMMLYAKEEAVYRLSQRIEEQKKLNKELELKIMQLEAQVEILRQGGTTYIYGQPTWIPIPNYVPFPSDPFERYTGDIIPPPTITIC